MSAAETENLVPVRIWWGDSTSAQLAKYTRNVYEERKLASNDFRQQTRLYRKYTYGSGNPDDLLYDLGHSGRGLDSFPREIELRIPKPAEVISEYGASAKGLEVELQTSSLVIQLANIAESYLQTLPLRQQDPLAYSDTIKLMQILAESLGDKKTHISLVCFGYYEPEDAYEVKEIE
ncbi:MAG: hypothetical protein M1142_04950 [Patescibacteria group bacterium]|nr:hypothetical protein [Patescibacteria group bacterium]